MERGTRAARGGVGAFREAGAFREVGALRSSRVPPPHVKHEATHQEGGEGHVCPQMPIDLPRVECAHAEPRVARPLVPDQRLLDRDRGRQRHGAQADVSGADT